MKPAVLQRNIFLIFFGAGPDLESAEVEYTEVEVSTLDPHRGNKLSGFYGYGLGAPLGMLLLPDTALILAPVNVGAGCAFWA